MTPSKRNRLLWSAYVGTGLFLVLLVLWLGTAGIAVQKVERFTSVDAWQPDDKQRLDISIRGTVSHVDVPFLVSVYTEKGPFHVTVAYNNYGDDSVTEVRICSIEVVWEGSEPLELVEGESPLVVSVRAEEHPNVTTSGVVLHTTQSARHTFGRLLNIPFSAEATGRCEMEAELIGKGAPQEVRAVWILKGQTLDFVRTYWAHLAAC